MKLRCETIESNNNKTCYYYLYLIDYGNGRYGDGRSPQSCY